jgi:cytochrome c-type biogenesis protein CcmH/NrfG
VLCGVAAVAVLVRRPSWPAFAVVFAAAALAPVSNLVLHVGVVLAERTLYSPSAGIVLLLATLAAPAFASARPLVRRAALAAAGLWCAVGAGFAWRDVPVWDSTARVVETFVARNPESYFGWMLRGDEYVRTNDRPSALEAYRRALALFDQDSRLVHAAAMQMLFAGDTASAERWLRVALTRWPGWGRPRTAYVRLLLARRRGAEAREVLTEGLRLEPDQRVWARLRDSLAAPTRTPRAP